MFVFYIDVMAATGLSFETLTKRLLIIPKFSIGQETYLL